MVEKTINTLDVYIPERGYRGGTSLRRIAEEQGYEFYAYENDPDCKVYAAKDGLLVCRVKDLSALEETR